VALDARPARGHRSDSRRSPVGAHSRQPFALHLVQPVGARQRVAADGPDERLATEAGWPWHRRPSHVTIVRPRAVRCISDSSQIACRNPRR
jgi:flavin-dependent dehydrogenase